VTVRVARPSDLDAVVELRLALLREHSTHPVFGRIRDDAESRARRIFSTQLRNTSTEVIFLAERDGEAIGILRCVHSIGYPLLHPDSYGYVSSVYVVPYERRKGVLKMLLAAAEQWCTHRGLDEMRLYSLPGNTESANAWQALGFEVVEQLRVRRIKER
jgi:GNAT superfamily N-acetyltransferase